MLMRWTTLPMVVGPLLLHHRRAELGEVGGVEVGDSPRFVEVFEHEEARGLVVVPTALREFARCDVRLLPRSAGVEEFLDSGARSVGARFLASVESVFLLVVLGEHA